MPERYPVPESVARDAQISLEDYESMYRASVDSPEAFWKTQSDAFLDWIAPWRELSRSDFRSGQVAWFIGGRLNASHNCLDRHLEMRGDQTAILWESDDGSETRHVSYRALHDEVCRLANLLKSRGVEKGSRVCIYLPLIPQAAAAMLACARIGAIHSVVFGGFSPTSLRDRILDADCSVLITADESIRGGKRIGLKANAEVALAECPGVHTVVCVRHTAAQDLPWQAGRDLWYEDSISEMAPDCEPLSMDSEDPLFILYTSGSTGKPKGVQHGTAGYLLHAAMTHKYVFDYRDREIYWCTADVGWITGHSYIVYGPLANGATTLMFEGVPTWPDASRFWQVVDKHQVSIFYTAPTAIRQLMAEGDEPVKSCSRRSLRILGTVGEPINPEAWDWYHRVVGNRRCPIIDTWWQTETGGIMIAPLPGATALKPGSATRPFFGVQPGLMDEQGQLIASTEASGNLVITASWPGQIRSVHGDHQRVIDTYYARYPGFYFTGDGARRDEDGYYWITGRVDDVINTSGHRIGTAELESALVLHESVAEAAVVGFPHEVKGEGIYCFVTPMSHLELDEDAADALRAQLIALVRREIGPFARPDVLRFAHGLPKTRSGKIMRRILRKIAAGESEDLGDISTLADPSVVESLLSQSHTPPKTQ